MNPSEPNKTSPFKLSLLTTSIILILNAVISLLAANFKPEYLSLTFDGEYLVYQVGLEGVVVLLCVLLTVLSTSGLTDFSFKTVLIRLSVLSIIYFLFYLVCQFIIYIVFKSNDFKVPQSVTSQFLNFKYFISGIKYSFVLIIVWMVLKYRKQNS
jgi:hypothetical protein